MQAKENELTSVEIAGILEENGSLLADKEVTQRKEKPHSSGRQLDAAEVSSIFP